MKKNGVRTIATTVVALAAALSAFVLPEYLKAQSPDVRITEVPPARTGNPNEMLPISGIVSGLSPKGLKVVIYAFAGDRWWVQPFDYASATEIGSNGKFETESHPGAIYAALVVKASFKPPATVQVLPDVGGDVVARTRVAGKKE